MFKPDLISNTEKYVRKVMEQKEGAMTIAHDFKHVYRVRNWALIIADAEKYSDLEIVEVAALLHDIGLSYLKEGDERIKHGPLGAEIAKAFLRDNSSLSAEQIDKIADAIYYHSLHPLLVSEHLQTLGEEGKLIEIVRDSDVLDGLGAVGIMRAFTSKHFLPEYDLKNIKGIAWGLSSNEFREKFGDDIKKGRTPVSNIIDQINQQIRTYDNLHTVIARKLAIPLVRFMKDFIIQLENEIEHSKTHDNNVLNMNDYGILLPVTISEMCLP